MKNFIYDNKPPKLILNVLIDRDFRSLYFKFSNCLLIIAIFFPHLRSN